MLGGYTSAGHGSQLAICEHAIFEFGVTELRTVNALGHVIFSIKPARTTQSPGVSASRTAATCKANLRQMASVFYEKDHPSPA